MVFPPVQDVSGDTFKKEHHKEMTENKVRVLLEGPPSPPSPVPEVSETEERELSRTPSMNAPSVSNRRPRWPLL